MNLQISIYVFPGKSSAAVVESLTLCKLYELNILFLKKRLDLYFDTPYHYWTIQ